MGAVVGHLKFHRATISVVGECFEGVNGIIFRIHKIFDGGYASKPVVGIFTKDLSGCVSIF